MKPKKYKFLNYGHFLEKEEETVKLTLSSFSKPLNTLDETVKYLLDTLSFALNLYQTTKDEEIKDYCKYYLSCGNAILHIIRSGKLCLTHGYYGSCAILFRTFLNYLNMAMYLMHHPSDVKLLLKESQDDFHINKEYKKKFHEFSIKKELIKLGHKIPDEEGSWAKIAHGSVWGAQVFGSKSLSLKDADYELAYSPRYSIIQIYSHISLFLPMSVDFSRYFLGYLSKKSVPNFNLIDQKLIETDSKVEFATKALKNAITMMTSMSDEEQEELEKLLESEKK